MLTARLIGDRNNNQRLKSFSSRQIVQATKIEHKKKLPQEPQAGTDDKECSHGILNAQRETRVRPQRNEGDQRGQATAFEGS
jgi:hypothetical protein